MEQEQKVEEKKGGLKEKASALWKSWRTGFIMILPIAVFILVLNASFHWLVELARWLAFTGILWLDTLLTALMLVIMPFVAHFLLSFRFVRLLGSALTGWIPIVGAFFRSLFREKSPDEPEEINKECEFYIFSHVKMLALATIRIREPEDWKQKDSPLIPWVMTIWATTPGVFTGPLQKVKESEVHYTGREVEELIVTGTSFGFKYEVKKWKNEEEKKTP